MKRRYKLVSEERGNSGVLLRVEVTDVPVTLWERLFKSPTTTEILYFYPVDMGIDTLSGLSYWGSSDSIPIKEWSCIRSLVMKHRYALKNQSVVIEE